MDPLILNTAGPHTPQYARQVAAGVAEAVRVLNHATFPSSRQALNSAADADAVLRELATMGQRLPQLCQQIGGWLEAQQRQGNLAVTYGQHRGDPSGAAAQVAVWLGAAGAAASEMAASLTAAAGITSTISMAGGDRLGAEGESGDG